MAKGSSAIFVAVILSFMLLQCGAITTYTVGDEFGWDLVIDIESWTQGKHFYAGDILVFNCDYQMREVVVVDKQGHDTCTVTPNAKVFESGNDEIPLALGANYFISNVVDECAAGLKMAINATKRP